MTITPHLSLVQRLLIYLLFVSILPLLGVGLVASNYATSALQTESRRSTQQLVNGQRDYLNLQLAQVETVLVNLSSNDQIIKFLQQESDFNNSYARLTINAQIGYTLNVSTNVPGLVSVSIYTNTKRMYHIGDTLDDSFDSAIAQRLYDNTFQLSKRFVWFGLEDNIHSNSTFKRVAVVTKGISVVDANGLQKPLAVLIANYSLDALADTLSTVNLGDNSTLLLVDSQRRTLYHSDPRQIGTRLESGLLAETDNADPRIQDVAGVASLISDATLQNVEWRLIGVVPLSTFALKTFPINLAIFVALAVALLIVLIVAVILNRDVIKPIRAVTDRFKLLSARDLSTGDLHAQRFSARLTERSGNDEIMGLLGGFNTFADTLVERREGQLMLVERTEERERLIQRLEETLRFKDEFLATMSHELRTPLNAIQGFTGLLEMEIEDTDQRRMILRILANSKRLLDLINDILDLSRLNSNRVELILKPVQLTQMLTHWHGDFKAEVEAKGLRFTLELPPDLPEIIIADEPRLTQIATNLIQNAIKFTENGAITISAEATDNQWSFTIADTGIGIAESWKHLIFDEFRQVDGSYSRKYGGAGLGLSIVKRLCTIMGGSVNVESEIGIGSSFTIILPLTMTSPGQNLLLTLRPVTPAAVN